MLEVVKRLTVFFGAAGSATGIPGFSPHAGPTEVDCRSSKAPGAQAPPGCRCGQWVGSSGVAKLQEAC